MRVLLLGANSYVAHEVAKRFAKYEHADLYLASRNLALLEKKAEDFQIRYDIRASAHYFDAVDFDSHREFYARLQPKPDIVVAAFGILGDQLTAQTDFTHAREIIDTNFTGAVSILEIIAADFQNRRRGTLLAISSVAGERGRKRNYMYGAAKGALSIYLSGLRNRLAAYNVHVLTVLPGFIQTKMTENMDLPQLLCATPGQVADDVYKALRAKRNVIYTRWYWKWITCVIKWIPELLFKRMSL